MYLHQGWWDGEEVVPESWVHESIALEPALRDPDHYVDGYGREIFAFAEGGYYKYMWYGLLREGQPHDFFATGNKGQFIYVSPSKNLIIVRHGEDYGVDLSDWVEIFYGVASRANLN